MSQDLAYSIQRLVSSAPAGTRAVEVEIARVVYRLDDGDVHSDILIRGAAMPESAEKRTSTALPLDPEGREVDPARMTPIQRVQAYTAEHGEDSRKLRDWAALVRPGQGPSHRELERAIEADLLSCARKAFGKDAGAKMINPADLIAYLVERHRMVAEDQPPEVWQSVIRNRGRTAA